MKKNIMFAAGLLLSSFVFAAPKTVEPQAVPGSFENASPAAMSQILALDSELKVSNDEFIIYYYRKDGDYEPWALWLWAVPGGDGGAAWPHTQKWSLKNGIGYMRFKFNGSNTGGVNFVSPEDNIGIIVRKKDGWDKDGKDDRIWNVKTSNKVAIFSGDNTTYAAMDYRPAIRSAKLSAVDKISISLSGKYALAVDGSNSKFTVSGSNGKVYEVSSVYNSMDPKNLAANFTKDIIIQLSEKADIGDSLYVNNPDFLSGCAVNSSGLAREIADSMIPAADEVLGLTYFSGSGRAEFSLWAPTSSSAVLNLYKSARASVPDFSVEMTKNEKTGVWKAVFAEQEPDGLFYDFTLKNSKGIVTVLDPYAKSMSANLGDGSVGRAAVVDLNSEKAGLLDAPYASLVKREDAVIYEVSVRDFTISADAKVKSSPGTYKAFVEKIPYLKELGITHVQLLPVVNFFYNNETNRSYENSGTVNGNNYNWGYDPHNYFTPEGWYASDAEDPYCRVRELRELINECHKAGLGVLLDVVYNHMASIQFLDDIVPGYYFRTDAKGSLKSNSGCGNDTATERPMMKKLVVDSTVHWVKNYKADGFRFDLMGLMESSSVIDSYKACAKINKSTLFEGEGWKMYNGPSGTFGLDQNFMLKTDSVAVFNDEFRDLMKAGGFNETGRGFITEKGVSDERLFRAVTGNPASNYRADQPGDNLNYTTCHDGLTLHDAIAHNLRLDETKDINEIVARIKLGNFMVLTSQGISFIHAGQEMGRTKPNVKKSRGECIGNFVRNSYDSSDNINQIIWTVKPEYQNLMEYTKGLIALRKTHGVFRLGDSKKIAKSMKNLEVEDALNLLFGYTIKDKKSTWIILINASKENSEFFTGVSVNGGVIYVDSDKVEVNGINEPVGVELSGKTVKLAPLTATIIKIN